MPRSASTRELAPVVRAADVFPGVLRPGLVAELARVRHGVELPCQASGDDVVGADVAGRRHVVLAGGRSQDDQVLEDLARIRRLHLHQRGRVPPQPLAEVHGAVGAERHDRLAGPGVDRLQVAVHLEQQPAVRAVLALPVVDPARGDAAQVLVDPDFLAGGRVDGDERVVPGEHVGDVVDDDRVEHVRDRVAARVGPRHAEPVEVGLVDLAQRDVPGVVRRAAVVRPVGGLDAGLERPERPPRAQGQRESRRTAASASPPLGRAQARSETPCFNR